MTPERIIVGEVRGGEAMDMLTAMNTGHEGSMCTWHGNSPQDACARLANMAVLGEERVSREALMDTISRTFDLIVQVRRVRGSQRRRVTEIFELAGGLANDGLTVAGHALWKLDREGVLLYQGIEPRARERFAEEGSPGCRHPGHPLIRAPRCMIEHGGSRA